MSIFSTLIEAKIGEGGCGGGSTEFKDQGRLHGSNSSIAPHGGSAIKVSLLKHELAAAQTVSVFLRYSEKSYSSTHDHHRHEDYNSHHGHSDRERGFKRSTQSYRESRSGDDRRDSDHGRSRDYRRSTDKYSRERPDYEGNRGKNKGREGESVECQKHKDLDSFSDRGRECEYVKDSVRCSGEKKDRSGKEYSGSYHKETQIYSKDSAEQKSNVAEKKRDRLSRGEYSEDGSGHMNDDNDSSAKKLKLVVSDDEIDERPMSSSSMTGQPAYSSTNQEVATHDLNAAKVAAMKAAELAVGTVVNKNLVAGGFMSADQKKKLLWGSKKSTAAEESGSCWDVSTFSDRERQEKFYKLMGAKGNFKTEQKSENNDGDSRLRAEKQQELQEDLEKQYTAGLRRRDGRTVGLGL
ncbi:hypothetical protein Scep_003800 [Stephania cephalantha]|uniref:Small acidic protein-like domain-containing protein n=1 Tax=Stephania cephalantha TaxID=152367 RepID=A0AAP0PYE6_9MAGN